jgi:integrase
MRDFEHEALVEANALTEQQYNNFLDAVETIPSMRSPVEGKIVRLAFELMEDSGVRIKELLHIKKEDIDFRTRILTITNPKSEKQCKCSKWKYKDMYTRQRVLVSADILCPKCKGKGKWKKPQRTTVTPRIIPKLYEYCQTLQDDDYLFPTTRQSFWTWGKAAGIKAEINIFQQKEERRIEGIFLHLFRALCSKRMVRDAKEDNYTDQLIQLKLRHSFQAVMDRYTKMDINYLIGWERDYYGDKEKTD